MHNIFSLTARATRRQFNYWMLVNIAIGGTIGGWVEAEKNGYGLIYQIYAMTGSINVAIGVVYVAMAGLWFAWFVAGAGRSRARQGVRGAV